MDGTLSAMSLPVERRHYTVEEYLRLERDAIERHEFRDGEIIAMSGGSVVHSQIISNCNGEIRSRLKGKPCRAYDSNLRVRIARKRLYSYPDVTVICGEPIIDPEDRAGETVTNPQLIVEVLSPSSEAFDRKTKFDRYRDLESFREYVLVSQEMPRVETYFRQHDGSWAFDVAGGVESVCRLRSIRIDLPLVEVYAGVTFPPAVEPQEESR